MPSGANSGDAAGPSSQHSPSVRPRDPQEFSGTPETDVTDWLKHYERVSAHNRWDDTIKLANVVFFLKDTALHWFENHEEEITSWESFVSAVQDNFGQTDARRQQAHGRLEHRIQTTTESSTTYIQDVLRLCARVDPNMPEADKVGHLFKGIAENLFCVIASKAPSTVKNFIDRKSVV